MPRSRKDAKRNRHLAQFVPEHLEHLWRQKMELRLAEITSKSQANIIATREAQASLEEKLNALQKDHRVLLQRILKILDLTDLK